MPKPIQLTLAEQLNITPHEIEYRKHLFDFTDADAQRLAACHGLIERQASAIVNTFYISPMAPRTPSGPANKQCQARSTRRVAPSMAITRTRSPAAMFSPVIRQVVSSILSWPSPLAMDSARVNSRSI